MFNEVEVKKDLLKSKTMARFSHYCHGNLYYNIVVMEELYQFPISTYSYPNLSEDLGTTDFNFEIRGSELARWISKSIKSETFIKL